MNFTKNKFKNQLQNESNELKQDYKEFNTKHAEQLSYNEWPEEVKHQNENLKDLQQHLSKSFEENNNEYWIYLENYDNHGRKKLQPIMKK